jgi:uncharacterized protein (TIGR03545 family)
MKEKKQGPIRFEAIIPFTLIVGAIYLYSVLFLDNHLKAAAEMGGYHLNGAEVNIGNLKTSFFKASIQIQNVELTNPDKPTHNSLVIGDIRFGMLWDALLRGKIVIEEVAVENVAIDVKRKKVGKVKPPPPPSPNDDALTKALVENKNKALGIIAGQNEDNALGGIAKILKGEAGEQDILNQVRSQLTAEKRTQEVETFLKQKQEEWKVRIASLPKASDFEKIGKDISQIQTQNFKTPEEIQNSINQFQSSLKELDSHIKAVDQAIRDLDKDSKKIQTEIKSIEIAVKQDLDQLKSFLSIPKVDLKDIMQTLIMDQIQPYLAKVGYYRSLAKTYMPPNLGKKEDPDQVELALQPRPRSHGTIYEFGKVGAYPLFWLKKISLSSKANASLGIGDLSGRVLDVTSHQALIQKPTRIQFNGDFPSWEISGLAFKGEFDNRAKESRIEYDFQIANYPIGSQNLIESSDIKVIMNPAHSRFESQGSLVGFRDLKLNFKKFTQGLSYQVESPNAMAKESLTQIFSDLSDFSFTAEIEGKLPHLAYRLDTDFGRKLGERIGRELGRLLEKFKKQAEAEIRNKLEAEKEKVNNQAKALEAQLKAQLDEAKKKAEAEKQKIEAQKVALENQIKEQLNQHLNSEKKKVESELNKAKEELKKKFGL